MTVENFSKLTRAKLLNTPSISAFKEIQLNPKKIKRGDLFIGDKKEDIELALHLEAYGILSTKPYQIIDKEIAWFIAPSIDDVLIRLLRFSLLNKRLRFIYLSHVKMQLLQKIADKEHMLFLQELEKLNYQKIINADENSLIFSPDRDFLEKIYPEFETLHFLTTFHFKTVKNTLFLSHFTYKNRTYKNIKIAAMFLNHLESVVTFLEQNSISYEIEKCSFTSHFHPIFVDQKLQIKHFGKSDRVLICEIDEKLIDQELSYIKEHAPWAKVIHVEDTSKLKNLEFNFAIIATTYEKLIEQLDKKQEQNHLF